MANYIISKAVNVSGNIGRRLLLCCVLVCCTLGMSAQDITSVHGTVTVSYTHLTLPTTSRV